MPPTIRAKREDTTFVPLVQYADIAAGRRADLTGRTIEATATLGRRTTPCAVEVVSARQGEAILSLAPQHPGAWRVTVSGLGAEFILQVEEDVTDV